MGERGKHHQVTGTTLDKRPVMWMDGQLCGPDFGKVVTLTRKNDAYIAHLHLGAVHVRVPLHTARPDEAHRRAEQLYDMSATAVEEIVKAAETGFLLRSEIRTDDSQDP